MEGTIIGTAVALWFAVGFYLNLKLQKVHDKLDRITEEFNGLREYLYEIDPQFDDERSARGALEVGEDNYAGADYMEIETRKRRTGARTLNTPFIR